MISFEGHGSSDAPEKLLSLVETVMLLKEIMTPNLEVVGLDTSIREAARKMASIKIGFLPVADEKGLAGVITDRDITIRSTAKGQVPGGTKVRDIMTRDVITCAADTDVDEAAKLMEKKQIRRLVVTDHNGGFIGVASLGDLAVKTGDEALSGAALQKISEPAQPER